MGISPFEVIGIVGVFLILLGYFNLQSQRWKSDDIVYLCCNIFGSLLILSSLYYAWNLPSFIIEMIWLHISVYGVYKKKKALTVKERP